MMTDQDLNRAVALARGWTEIEDVNGVLVGVRPELRDYDRQVGTPFQLVPDICTDPAAWGALLEEIAAAGLEPELKHSVHGGWSVWIYEGPRGAAQARASDPTLGRALVKAFLASKGVDS